MQVLAGPCPACGNKPCTGTHVRCDLKRYAAHRGKTVHEIMLEHTDSCAANKNLAHALGDRVGCTCHAERYRRERAELEVIGVELGATGRTLPKDDPLLVSDPDVPRDTVFAVYAPPAAWEASGQQRKLLLRPYSLLGPLGCRRLGELYEWHNGFEHVARALPVPDDEAVGYVLSVNRDTGTVVHSAG